LMSALHRDAMLVRFTSRLRKKYGACYLYLPVLGSKTLLVLDLSGIRRVLDASPAIYADPEPKRQGMSRFQPGALTISRGLLWQQRRRFNEAVLDFGRGLPRHANHHLEIIRNETRTLLERSRTTLRWKDFDRLFERITLSILFGRSAASDVYLTRTLTRLMRNGNRSRFVPAKKALLESFQAAVRGYLWWPEPKSLARLCREVAPSVTRVESQITHWMFAMNETLATNTVRALALINRQRAGKRRSDSSPDVFGGQLAGSDAALADDAHAFTRNAPCRHAGRGTNPAAHARAHLECVQPPRQADGGRCRPVLPGSLGRARRRLPIQPLEQSHAGLCRQGPGAVYRHGRGRRAAQAQQNATQETQAESNAITAPQLQPLSHAYPTA
jgi:hypothetical protein